MFPYYLLLILHILIAPWGERTDEVLVHLFWRSFAKSDNLYSISYKPINILDDFGTLFHSSLDAAAIAKQYASSYRS